MIKHYDLLVQHAFFLFGAGLVTASCQGEEIKANGVNSTLILTGAAIILWITRFSSSISRNALQQDKFAKNILSSRVEPS
jgi:hypothetical protein